MTPAQIARAFELFGTVLSASSEDFARRRTSYFYRAQAIEWARLGRQRWPGDMQARGRRLAKNYLSTYRKMRLAK